MHTQRNTRLSTKITSWANVTREEIATRKQRFRDDSSSLRKKWEVMNRREIKEVQKKSVEQILQRIADVSTGQRDLIVSLCKLSSDDISLHAVSSDAWANLKKTQTWAKEITSLTRVARQTFAVLTHEVHTTIDMSNQEKIIERLIKDNARLHEDLKVLRIVWFKKIADSEKAHSSLIVEIAIEAMVNRLMNVSMLNSYQECACELSLYAKVWFSFRVLANLTRKTHKSASNLVANRANTWISFSHSQNTSRLHFWSYINLNLTQTQFCST